VIRRLWEPDREIVRNLLDLEPEMNLYLIGNLDNFGFEHDDYQLHGEFVGGELAAVLGRSRSQLTYYARHAVFNPAWKAIIESFDWLFLSAKEPLIRAMRPYFPDTHVDHMDFMRTTTFTPDADVDYSDVERLSTEQDAREIYAMLSTIEELYTVYNKAEDEFVRYLLENSGANGTTVFVRRDGRIVSSASAVFETDHSAMIVGVGTHAEYRQQGLGKKVLHYLMDLYVNQKGKTLCLYYDDPRAEKLYVKLGFENIGRWSMLSKP